MKDAGFAIGSISILAMLFVPLPSAVIDAGLAFSIALSILILMVALWIERPLEFSSFPTILLIATLLRLGLNVATTRLILTNGAQGPDAAGHVIAGFANFVMGGDFVIGLIVFVILVTVNFIVISKGATRIAEVGARFTLDAIPGKQMAIDADMSAGVIDEKEATRRRRELEEESAFFGAMDGASKFVRGDAIAGLIITAVNIVGGIVIGVTRHGMSLGAATDVFTKLSVGDGLVSQMPALIISLAAGLLVSKGGTLGSAEAAVVRQLGNYPKALTAAGSVMLVLALAPGLPFLAFSLIGSVMLVVSAAVLRARVAKATYEVAEARKARELEEQESRSSIRESLKTAEIELCIGKQLAGELLVSHDQLAQRVGKMRRKFARQFGFVIPEIKLSNDLGVPAKSYQIKVHGTVIATHELRIGDVLVVLGDGPVPTVPHEETREPAFGVKAAWVAEAFSQQLREDGLAPVDNISVLLTHLGEVIRSNLSQLLSYRDMRGLLERLEPEYRRLLEEMIPSQLSYSSLQAVLKALLAECVSIRNLHLILEAVAEIVPHVRRTEQICEHVRMRMAQQICGDLLDGGCLKLVRLGNRWDLAFHQSLKRDAKGEVVEFDVDPRLIEQFGTEAGRVIRPLLAQGHQFAIVAPPEARPYVRMISERIFPMLPVLSHLEISRGVQVSTLGSLS